MKKRITFRSFVPAILWFLLMCVLFFIPGSEVPSFGWMQRLHVDKIVHFILFFILIILFCIPILKSGLNATRKLQLMFTIAILSIIFGILTEYIQDNFVKGRSFDLWDWVADTFGILIAIYVVERLKTAFSD